VKGADVRGQGQAGPEVLEAGIVRVQVTPDRAEGDGRFGLLLDRADLARGPHRTGGQAHRGVHVVGAPQGRGQRGKDDRVRPGHLVGGQQGERLFQGGDRLGLPAGVPQGARPPVEHQRAPDRVALGREPGQGLVE
jgi:hypothetical protein